MHTPLLPPPTHPALPEYRSLRKLDDITKAHNETVSTDTLETITIDTKTPLPLCLFR